MELLSNLALGFGTALDPFNLLYCFIGVLLGTAVTLLYATFRSWPAVLPPVAIGGALVVTVLIGALAGVYPAVRASRMSPTEALA